MSDTNSPRRIKPKKSVTSTNFEYQIDYNDLEGLTEHPLGAVRRGLYARHLAELRNRAGYNQSELARILNVLPPTIGKWERGDTGLSWLDARRIAKALGCDPHLLYDDPELRIGANLAAPPDAALPYNVPDAPPVPEVGARWWQMSGHALALRGIQHDDLVAIAGKRYAHDGCIALLTLGEPDGQARYMLRERAGGYFVGCGPGPLPEPIPYAPEYAHVLGIAIALYRPLVKSEG